MSLPFRHSTIYPLVPNIHISIYIGTKIYTECLNSFQINKISAKKKNITSRVPTHTHRLKTHTANSPKQQPIIKTGKNAQPKKKVIKMKYNLQF